jgi:hypothetical protein
VARSPAPRPPAAAHLNWHCAGTRRAVMEVQIHVRKTSVQAPPAECGGCCSRRRAGRTMGLIPADTSHGRRTETIRRSPAGSAAPASARQRPTSCTTSRRRAARTSSDC